MDDEKVIDAEVVEEAPLSQDFPGLDDANPDGDGTVGDAAILLNLYEMIRNYIQSIDKIREEKKKHQEMFEDYFVNNPVYRENAEKAK